MIKTAFGIDFERFERFKDGQLKVIRVKKSRQHPETMILWRNGHKLTGRV